MADNKEEVRPIRREPILSVDVDLTRSATEYMVTDEEKAGEGVTVDEQPSEKITCIKTLTEGHNAIRVNLNRALTEVSSKEAYKMELEEETDHQQEKNLLLEERTSSLKEKLCWLTKSVELNEKKQETLFTQIVDAKWKLQEARQFMERLDHTRATFDSKRENRRADLSRLDKLGPTKDPRIDKIQCEIKRLQAYKKGLQTGDVGVCAIQNGNRMMELEQKKRALRDAMNERRVKTELMYVEIDEKTERVEQLKQQLSKSENHYGNVLLRARNQHFCLTETQRRLKSSMEYIQSKIDYGLRIPALPQSNWKRNPSSR